MSRLLVNDNMQSAKNLVYDRTIRAKESIQGHPLDPKQTMAMFSAKVVGNFRYLTVVTPWRQRELDRLDKYCRQGFKTAWCLNESTAGHPWTTPKNMAGMGNTVTTTLAVLSHVLHAYIERCMKGGCYASDAEEQPGQSQEGLAVYLQRRNDSRGGGPFMG
jgi:hypothetical protein